MMGSLLQLFVHRCDKCMASCGGWVYILVGNCGWQASTISTCIWQVSIGLYQCQNKAKSSGLNCEN